MAFRINGEITLDGSGFQRGLNSVASSSAHFLKNFAFGAFGVYGVEQAIHKTIESAEELINTSKNMSLTIEQLQVLRQAAKENGVEFETLTKALQGFNAVRENILNGGKGSAAQLAALGRLGVSKEALQNQTAGSTFMNQISQTAQRVNPADIAKDLRDVFGRGGQELFGTLGTDFGELENKMRSYGAIMDTTTAIQLKNFKDSMDLIGRIATVSIAPALVEFGRFILMSIGHIQSFGQWLKVLYSSSPASKVPIRLPGESWFHANFLRKPIYSDSDTAKTWADAFQKAQNAMGDPDKILSEFDKRVKLLAAKLDNPTQASIFGGASEASKAKHNKALDVYSDSLVSVGNFLGAGKNAINNIAQQQLDVAKLQLQKLDEIKTSIDNIEGVDFGG